MNKYNFAISIIVTLMILDFFIMGYCLGLLDYFKIGAQPRNVSAVITGTTNSSARTPPQQSPSTQAKSKQEQQTEQPTPEDNQQEQQTEENNDTKSYTREEINNMIADTNLSSVCSESELLELAEMDSSFQDKTINGETCYISMVGGAEYPRGEFFWVGSESLNVYTSDNRVIGKITDNFVSSYDDFMVLIDGNSTSNTAQSSKKTYTRTEVNNMISVDYADNCGLFEESELDNDIIQDKKINGENCYIGQTYWNNGMKTRFFYVGSESLNVYNEAEELIGTVTDDFFLALQ